MRRRRHALLAALLGAALLPLRGGWAAPPGSPLLAQVQARLADAPVVRGEFEQSKMLQGFKSPLLSRGSFLVARERGVWWATREPFASTLVVTGDRLLSRNADGSVATQVDAEREPGIRAIHELLLALMAADLTRLAQRFHVDGRLQGKDAWALVLRPRDAALAQWVSRVELEGDRFVRVVRLTETQGDSSVIRLRGQVGAASLSRDELVRFE